MDSVWAAAVGRLLQVKKQKYVSQNAPLLCPIQSVVDAHMVTTISRQIDGGVSVCSLSPEAHHSTMENLLRPNQCADISA